ncbi:MAG: maltose acetyltransferase domain-containing protein, partial [Oscillospiraceae bacterium]
MTEEEKIFAGKLFDARTKELGDIKHIAHSNCQRFNSMDERDEDRLPLVKNFIGAIGKKYYFQGPIQFNYGTHTFIGENFFANFNLTVMDDGRIYIGDNVMCGPNVSLMATNHPLIAAERTSMKYPDGHISMSEYADDIHIGNNVWLACNVVVLGGVT